ncbi:MAG: hypothetical protein AAGI03_03075 [Pseudomonadota bacterium]
MREIIDVDIWSEPEAVLRSPEYVQELARFYRSLGLSAEGCLNWLILAICYHNSGDFFDHDQMFIDLNHEDILEAFGMDTRRTFNTFLKSAEAKPKRLVQKRNVKRMMWLCLAYKTQQASSVG